MTACLARPYALGAQHAQKHKSPWPDECHDFIIEQCIYWPCQGRTSWQGGGVVRTGPRPWASRGLPYVGPMPMYPGLIIAAGLRLVTRYFINASQNE
eukprot:scaffold59272_cov19-Prasinocladus_malaysianus.AAC.1